MQVRPLNNHLDFAGRTFHVVGEKSLYWPDHKALIVADLHLEKGSWYAVRGQMLPPHDSLATLEAVSALITLTGAEQVWTLGDNFHDEIGLHRMTDKALSLLNDVTQKARWLWITGNHDEHLPSGIGGTVMQEAEIDGLILRHIAEPHETRPELSGHYHPKYRAVGKRGRVTRPCFVRSQTKLILPAFGSLTGGLWADDDAVKAAFVGQQAQAFMAIGKALCGFPV
jgi:uncharacterized protein